MKEKQQLTKQDVLDQLHYDLINKAGNLMRKGFSRRAKALAEFADNLIEEQGTSVATPVRIETLK